MSLSYLPPAELFSAVACLHPCVGCVPCTTNCPCLCSAGESVQTACHQLQRCLSASCLHSCACEVHETYCAIFIHCWDAVCPLVTAVRSRVLSPSCMYLGATQRSGGISKRSWTAACSRLAMSSLSSYRSPFFFLMPSLAVSP